MNCNGKLVDLSTARVMGILNCTPNSFYDGGKYKTDIDFLKQVEAMLRQGASFVDLGAYSSKPSAAFVSEDEELSRIIPVVELLVGEFPEILISLDTFRSKVAQEGVKSGAALINDISAGLLDDSMMQTVAQLGVPYIMMHMRGNPQSMQKLTHYTNLLQEILYYFSERVAQARQLGINDIIVDPGFGFSKTLDQNYQLLRMTHLIRALKLPILVGVSRKSMIYNLLDISPAEALNGTTVLNTLAIQQGANILRVHDVAEAVQTIQILKHYDQV